MAELIANPAASSFAELIREAVLRRASEVANAVCALFKLFCEMPFNMALLLHAETTPILDFFPQTTSQAQK
jgi:hypothetical protein